MTELASIARWAVSRVFPFGDGTIVAAETGSDDRRVIDSCRYPAPGVVTVLTGREGQDVTGIFALGDSTIVTTNTVASDTRMIVAGTHPCDGIVTVIAGVRTHDVPGIFTLGNNAVVTALATSDHGNVINSKHVGPYRWRVTNLAFTDNPYVLAGRGAGFYATGQRMASGALRRRTNKNSLHVAGFARYQGMFEIQRIPRIVMIEIGTNLERSGAACIKPAQHQQSRQGEVKA